MILKPIYYTALTFFLFSVTSLMAQNSDETQDFNYKKDLKFYQYRGSNVIDVALGTSIINGDFVDPIFEIYSHFGYKRYVIPYLNINFGYNKFNLAYKDVLNEGFMSFDLNIESTLFPYGRFSPYIFAGGGVNASNYFTQVDAKVQGGFGIEYIVADGIGIKLFSDYNYVFSDELDGLIYGDADDIYWRMAFGLNYYFGGNKKKNKILEGQPTIINSNPISPKN